jgi:disulfide bond formation protein DsbB
MRVRVDRPQGAAWSAGFVALAAAAALVAALIFQYGFGYAPCALCLIERWPYYIGIPLAGLTALLAARRAPPLLVAAGLGLVAIDFLVGFGLGAFHAGVEWKLWAGPAACTAGAAQIGGNLLESLRHTHIVPCDAATWRLLGLSFAGWNAVVSLILGAVALAAFHRRAAAA